VGYGFGDQTASFVGGDPLIRVFTAGTGFGTGTPVPSASYDLKASPAACSLAIMFRSPQWVIGIETDFNGLDFNNTASSSFGFGIRAAGNTLVATQKADWFGTLRGRIGWLPTDTLLVYGTGGLAYGQVKETLVFNQNGAGGGDGQGFGYQCNGTGANCMVGSSSKVGVGYTVGAGLEYAISRNFTFKAEYLYVNLGSTSAQAFTVVPRAGGFAPASFVANFGDFDFNVVRAGVNYRF
jgi:outer membrane immunogenic protein